MVDLSGKAAVVTGSTKGIGRAIARALVEAGASVAVSARTAEEVEGAARELGEGAAGTVVGIPCDVSDPESCTALLETAVERLGRLDILVNNAGVGRFASIEELSVEDWRAQIGTNLDGVFYCSKAAVPALKKSGDGWILNIGSLAGRNTFAGGTGYNASKFGLVGLSEAMMLDLRHEGIRVTLIMPGSVDTWFNDSEPAGGGWKLQPEDVAQTVLDLVAYPDRALLSRVEMRPSRPPRK